jgi:hypothetical protein
VLVGPVRVFSEREVSWNLRGSSRGHHLLVFEVSGQSADKDLAVGDGYMRVSARRPAARWLDVLEHPGEQPFAADSPVQWIKIEYPERSSWVSGTDWWVAYWFGVSFVAALCFRRPTPTTRGGTTSTRR